MNRMLERARSVLAKQDESKKLRKKEEYIDHFPDYEEFNGEEVNGGPTSDEEMGCIDQTIKTPIPKMSSTPYRLH